MATITSKEVLAITKKILNLMTDDHSISDFMDALMVTQCTIIAQACDRTKIQAAADEIRNKIIANTKYIKEKYKL